MDFYHASTITDQFRFFESVNEGAASLAKRLENGTRRQHRLFQLINLPAEFPITKEFWKIFAFERTDVAAHRLCRECPSDAIDQSAGREHQLVGCENFCAPQIHFAPTRDAIHPNLRHGGERFGLR